MSLSQAIRDSFALQSHVYTGSMHDPMTNNVLDTSISSILNIGVAAHAVMIHESNEPMKERRAKLVRLISGLDNSAAEKVVAKFMQFDSENLNRLDKSKMTYRYLLKHPGYAAIFALAMAGSEPYMVEALLGAYMAYGSWAEFDDTTGFSMPSLVNAFRVLYIDKAGELGAVVNNLQEAAALYQKADGPAFAATTEDDTATHPTNTQGVTTMPALAINNDNLRPVINVVLNQAGIAMTIDQILDEANAKNTLQTLMEDMAKVHAKEVDGLRMKLASVPTMPTTMAVQQTGTLPAGTMNMVPVGSIFPSMANVKMDVPQFTWTHPHPDVPAVNDNYIFRNEMLLKVLRCLVRGEENGWMHGHTGSGKTTFVEQVAARLGWPVARIAFDSNVDRYELIGRLQIEADGQGGTSSKWLPGIIERAMTGGYILLCDEMDAGHPNALYVMQPILEGKPFTLLEDGGRIVQRGGMFRIFATGNTTGNGDPSGLYPACRILSAATLDRFQTFVNVPYMTLNEEIDMISNSVPGLTKTLVKQLAKFAGEMRTAFTTLQTPISYSPRRSIAFAREIVDLKAMGFTDENAVITSAFKSKLYDAASEEYRQRITEIAGACFGNIDPTKNLL